MVEVALQKLLGGGAPWLLATSPATNNKYPATWNLSDNTVCKWLDAPVFSDEDENYRPGAAHYTFTDLTLVRQKWTSKWLARYLVTISGNDQPKCLSFQNCGMGRKGRTTVTWDRRVFPVFIFIGLRSAPRKTSEKGNRRNKWEGKRNWRRGPGMRGRILVIGWNKIGIKRYRVELG